jgi:hypothetical protein
MSTTVAELADVLQEVFTTTAEEAAAASRCIRRVRKLTGATLVQTLVFGWLQNPQASLEELCMVAAELGVELAPQSLDERFTEPTADCLRRVLAQALDRLVAAEPAHADLLQRFAGVYALDATSWALPASVAAIWPGCGGGPKADPVAAAVKVLLRLEITSGTLEALDTQAGRVQDLQAPLAWAPLPAGSLLLDDLGFFDLERLQHYDSQGVYFLSRLRAHTDVWYGGRRWKLADLLRRYAGQRLDLQVEVGKVARLPCRLLAVPVPEAVAQQRLKRLKRQARSRGHRVSAARQELCGWNVLITNAPVRLLSLDEAWALRRLRWQMELLFKVWKSEGKVDETRGERAWRVVCEAYAKLLAMVVQHWVTLVGGGSPLVASARRAARVVRAAAVGVARALEAASALGTRLARIAGVLRKRCRVQRRQGRPSALQLVQDPSLDPSARPIPALT